MAAQNDFQTTLTNSITKALAENASGLSMREIIRLVGVSYNTARKYVNLMITRHDVVRIDYAYLLPTAQSFWSHRDAAAWVVKHRLGGDYDISAMEGGSYGLKRRERAGAEAAPQQAQKARHKPEQRDHGGDHAEADDAAFGELGEPFAKILVRAQREMMAVVNDQIAALQDERDELRQKLAAIRQTVEA